MQKTETLHFFHRVVGRCSFKQTPRGAGQVQVMLLVSAAQFGYRLLVFSHFILSNLGRFCITILNN